VQHIRRIKEQPILAGIDDEGDVDARFMTVVIRKGFEMAAADPAPGAEAVARMTEYNKSLQ
jgi:hypothetical protein